MKPRGWVLPQASASRPAGYNCAGEYTFMSTKENEAKGFIFFSWSVWLKHHMHPGRAR